ncbi:hypothetical protein [Tenacibaculum maritimum]|nr:hypothetical protein [Tenacibaculum maritimum]
MKSITMKNIGFILLTISIFQCKSISFEKTPPFTIKEASYYNYTGGIRGVSGTWVRINYDSKKAIEFDSIYYQGRKTKAELQNIANKIFVSGHFNTSTVNNKNDLILHKNKEKEFHNQLPKKSCSFKLKENEAIISYFQKGKKKYYKINSLKQEKSPLHQ